MSCLMRPCSWQAFTFLSLSFHIHCCPWLRVLAGCTFRRIFISSDSIPVVRATPSSPFRDTCGRPLSDPFFYFSFFELQAIGLGRVSDMKGKFCPPRVPATSGSVNSKRYGTVDRGNALGLHRVSRLGMHFACLSLRSSITGSSPPTSLQSWCCESSLGLTFRAPYFPMLIILATCSPNPPAWSR
jgi:hypothetical protein